MENNKDMMGVTFTGDVTIQGPMFDIHHNEHVHISVDGLGKGQSAPTEQVVETGVTKQKEVDWDLVGKAVKDCMSYFWGHAAFATIFCICRDEYGFPDNASGFEHKMNEMNIECPKGTIANAIRNNPFMKKPINKWEKDNATPRIQKLIEVFRESVKSFLGDSITT